MMDKAYEGNETQQLVLALERVPVVPLKRNRLTKWEYDKRLYKKTKRGRAIVSSPQGFSAYLLTIR